MPSCHAEPRTDSMWSSILQKLFVKIIQVLYNMHCLFDAIELLFCILYFSAIGKQEDLLDLLTALLKFNCFLSAIVATQCTP